MCWWPQFGSVREQAGQGGGEERQGDVNVRAVCDCREFQGKDGGCDWNP